MKEQELSQYVAARDAARWYGRQQRCQCAIKPNGVVDMCARCRQDDADARRYARMAREESRTAEYRSCRHGFMLGGSGADRLCTYCELG